MEDVIRCILHSCDIYRTTDTASVATANNFDNYKGDIKAASARLVGACIFTGNVRANWPPVRSPYLTLSLRVAKILCDWSVDCLVSSY